MLTLFSHYLQSNKAPSEDEAREIKALRAISLEEISIIDAEIEKIEGILDSLKRKRAHIQTQGSVDDFNTILAPVRRLPPDVLGAILCHCLATHRNPIMIASEAPILLTQICRDWRSIALSNPQLWSRLYIPALPVTRVPEGERRMEALTEEVQRWLRLSDPYPLAITLPATGLSHPPLLDSIIQSSRRWQQLELGCFLSVETDVLTRVLNVSSDDLCMLREIRIHQLYSTFDYRSHEMQDHPWYQSLLTAQGLRSIFIADLPEDKLNTNIPPNWKNLNHVFIHSRILLGHAHRILTYCCNLKACLLEIAWEQRYANTLDDSVAILPHLTYLSLHGEEHACNVIICSIEAPSLQVLDCQGLFPSDFDELGGSIFFQKINSLETFRVDHRCITELESQGHVLKYFTHIPSVKHLVLDRPRKVRMCCPSHTHDAYPEHDNLTLITTLHKFRHQYSFDSAPTVLFPSLETFEAYGIFGVTDLAFLEFIKARIDATKSNAGVSKLKKVFVEFLGTRQTDIIPEALAYAQAAGIKLELDLTYHTPKKEVNSNAAWSPSYGLSPNDVSWEYPSPLYEY